MTRAKGPQSFTWLRLRADEVDRFQRDPVDPATLETAATIVNEVRSGGEVIPSVIDVSIMVVSSFSSSVFCSSVPTVPDTE